MHCMSKSFNCFALSPHPAISGIILELMPRRHKVQLPCHVHSLVLTHRPLVVTAKYCVAHQGWKMHFYHLGESTMPLDFLFIDCQLLAWRGLGIQLSHFYSDIRVIGESDQVHNIKCSCEFSTFIKHHFIPSAVVEWDFLKHWVELGEKRRWVNGIKIAEIVWWIFFHPQALDSLNLRGIVWMHLICLKTQDRDIFEMWKLMEEGMQ